MVSKLKISHEQTVHEKGQSLNKNSTNASVSLKLCLMKRLQPATVYPVPLLNWISQGGKKPKPTKKPGSASGTFLYFYQLGKATRSFSCTQEHYGLDCSFTEEQLILGGRWTLHVIPENVLTLEENEAAPKQSRNLDSIFQHHKEQMLLLREIKARHLFLKKNKTKKAECFFTQHHRYLFEKLKSQQANIKAKPHRAEKFMWLQHDSWTHFQLLNPQ